MKSLKFIPVLIILILLAQSFLPWWIIAVVSFVVCYVFNPGQFIAFSGSLLTVFAIWIIKSYIADHNFDTAMSSLLGQLFGNISSGAIFFLTGISGGIIAGLFGLLGNWTRNLSR